MANKNTKKILWTLASFVFIIAISLGAFLFANGSSNESKKSDTETIVTKVSPNDEELEKNDIPIVGEQSYAVNDGEISPAIENAAGRRAVEYFEAIAGDNFDEYINEIILMSDESTDEEASVITSDTDPVKWVLRINLAFSGKEEAKKDMIYNLVHEYAHIFSLNDTQVDGFIEGACPALEISEGCANPGSYIDDFENAFWLDLNADPNSEEFGGYYEDHEDDFVSEYAATNVIEDFAETFAHYTLKKSNKDGWSDSLAVGKIFFMADNPEIKAEVNRIKKAVKKL